MKLVILTYLYTHSVQYFYSQYSNLSMESFRVQKDNLDAKLSLWASGWSDALQKRGYEVITIPVNVTPLQKQWAHENGILYQNLHETAFSQVQKFKPDILWYDYFDVSLLQRIKSFVPSVKLVLGWTGSALVNIDILKETDLVLSCAPETVEKLKGLGIPAQHLHHAFNPAILNHPELKSVQKEYKLTFIGQIFRGDDYHQRREALLKKIARKYDLKIFSPMANYGLKKVMLSAVKKAGYWLLLPFTQFARVKKSFGRSMYFNEIMKAGKERVFPYDRELKKKALPAVYGIEMFKTIMQSDIVLNIHADSSFRYASNMRLFETPGVGTCLLTDWKENLGELFNDGLEVVSYRSNEECLEKIQWLHEHPDQCREIGQAGQRKILTTHTYDHRAEEWISIVNKQMSH